MTIPFIAIATLILGLVVLLALVFVWKRRNQVGVDSELSPEQERLAMAFPDDGIADIYIGLILILFGVFMFTEMPWLAGALVASFIPAFQSSKKNFTAPRIAKTGFSPRRPEGNQILIISLLILGVLALVAGMLAFGLTTSGLLPDWLWQALFDYGLIMVGSIGTLIWMTAAYFTEARRYYGYAALSLILAILTFLLGLPFPVYILSMGLMVLLVGSFYLFTFVRRYPRPLEA